MKWNDHSKLVGQHAFLSASKYSWLRYTEEALLNVFANAQAAEQGTADHAYAALSIQRRQKLSGRSNLANYVNDAIGFRMTPEQVLYYSEFCFGTADAIYYDPQKRILRIHDLKTGTTPAKMDQLYIYAGLFCLEYHVKPKDLTLIELRIYQNGEVATANPTAEEIDFIIDKIIESDKILMKAKYLTEGKE